MAAVCTMAYDLNCLVNRILAAAREVARDRERRSDAARVQAEAEGAAVRVMESAQPVKVEELKPQGRVEDPWP